MTALHAAFDAMVRVVCSSTDYFDVAWKAYERDGLSADAVTSTVWSSTARVPPDVAALAGIPGVRTYRTVAQHLRDWYPEEASAMNRYTPKFDEDKR
jgi:hypothetical protein